jgi:hypothetical protein
VVAVFRNGIAGTALKAVRILPTSGDGGTGEARTRQAGTISRTAGRPKQRMKVG